MYNLEFRQHRNKNAHWDKELEKFFDVFSKTDYFAPVCEIFDEDKFFTISLDIPGLTENEIHLEVKDNRLHITGERKSTFNGSKENLLRTEKHYGQFSRVFGLPQNVNADAIEAKFKNGVLDVRLPKEKKSQSKKITINGWNSQMAEFKN